MLLTPGVLGSNKVKKVILHAQITCDHDDRPDRKLYQASWFRVDSPRHVSWRRLRPGPGRWVGMTPEWAFSRMSQESASMPSLDLTAHAIGLVSWDR